MGQAAAARWTAPPIADRELSAVIVYFYRNGSIDVDNLIKPILDGLVGIVVPDDVTFAQVIARKTELKSGLSIINAPPSILENLDTGSDFIFVRIDTAPNHSELP